MSASSDFKKVLDHGHVRLDEQMGTDLSIVRNARCSYDAEWLAGKDQGSDSRLIHYLLKNGHTTPFEAVVFTFDIKAPIFVFRQWHRHRTQSYNELSARYKKLPEEWYIPKPEVIGVQAKDNKQMRDIESGKHTIHAENAASYMQHLNEQSYRGYEDLLKHEVPRELARSVLPLAMYSHMFCTVNLHNLFKFIAQRDHDHAQWEIRQYAIELTDIIRPFVPVAVEAFEEYVHVGKQH